jgi:histidinol-phosphate aminotransferase
LTGNNRFDNVWWEKNMGNAISRRQWLKRSALAFGGLMSGTNLGPFPREPSFLQLFSEEEGLIRLESNESPFGISEKAREAICRSIGLANRYPHRHYPQLTELIARREGISPDCIILGAGSTEVMVTLIHLAKSRGEILAADPTYFDFVYYAGQADCPLVEIKLNDDLEHDLETMGKRVSTKTGLVYICNPLNPTGTITPAHKLRPFCERVSQKALVVVDEAYHEYVEDPDYSSMVELVKEGKNVIVTRTFSKIFGLAGLRIGYGMADPEIIKSLKKMSRNFAPVSWLSLRAAIASYQDLEFTRRVREKNRQMRRYLGAELDRLGLSYAPSQTNFLLFQVGQDAEEMAEEFEQRRILVRPFNFYGRNWIRVSIGTQKDIQAFLSALADFV